MKSTLFLYLNLGYLYLVCQSTKNIRSPKGLWDNIGKSNTQNNDEKINYANGDNKQWNAQNLKPRSNGAFSETKLDKRFENWFLGDEKPSVAAVIPESASFWKQDHINLLEHGKKPPQIKRSDDWLDNRSKDGLLIENNDKEDHTGAKFSGERRLKVLQRDNGQQHFGESTINEVMRIHKLTADTLDSLQENQMIGEHRFSANRRSGGRRPPAINRRQGEFDNGEVDMINEEERSRLVAQVNAVNVLDMIKSLQDEIKEIDNEIQAEHENIRKLKETKQIEQELEKDVETIPISNVAQESAEETMKELTLQKEDTTMKKIIAQMMLMKQIQKKKSESEKLELALRALGDRRKVINSALKQQREIAEEKRRLAKQEIERQKEIMAEKERVIQEILQRNKEENRNNGVKLEQQRLQANIRSELQKQGDLKDKATLLQAHLRLVDRSNDRILARLQEIKLQREREAIAEQERVLQEQQAAINALRKMKKDRNRKEKLRLRGGGRGGGAIESIRSGSSGSSAKLTRVQELLGGDLGSFSVSDVVDIGGADDNKKEEPLERLREAALINLQPGERRKVLEWLDLERNAAILQKTDKKIAQKLRAKNAATSLRLKDEKKSPAEMIKNAAQILLEEGEDELTDAEIDEILGIAGIDNGLTVESVFGIDPSLLDDDSIAFPGDYEYEEVEYEYEDVSVVGNVDDYYEDTDYVEKEYVYEYEYEETLPALPALPKPTVKPKPRYRPVYTDNSYHNPAPAYNPYAPSHHTYDSYEPAYEPYEPPTYHPPPSYHTRPAYTSSSGGRYSGYGKRPSPTTSGAEFLSNVSGLLGEAETNIRHGVRPHITLTGSLRSALLRDVDEKVQTEVHRLPGGRVSTKVHIGLPSNPVTSRVPTDKSFRDTMDRFSSSGRNAAAESQRIHKPRPTKRPTLSLSGSLASSPFSSSSRLTGAASEGSNRDRLYSNRSRTTQSPAPIFPFLETDDNMSVGGVDSINTGVRGTSEKLIATRKPSTGLSFSNLLSQQEFNTPNRHSFGSLVHTRG